MYLVVCKGEDGAVEVHGPFEDRPWARAWLKQHAHPVEMDTEKEVVEAADIDHFCLYLGRAAAFEMGYNVHEIVQPRAPGFDPTTVPAPPKLKPRPTT